MPHPKVKIADNSGNEVAVTSNALDVNIAGGASIDIGDVDMFLDGGTAIVGGTGNIEDGVLRVTIAMDDYQIGALGSAADIDGNIHGQLRYIANSLSGLGTQLTLNNLANNIGFALSTTGAQYSEGDGGFLATGVRNDTLASLVSVDHDHAPFQVNADGALYVEAALSSTDNAVLDAMVVDLAAMEALLITIDSDTDAIKTAVQILDDWDDSNYANVNINLAGSDAPTGGGTESGVLRVTLANDSTGVLTVDNAGTFATQIDGDALTALEKIDDIQDVIGTDATTGPAKCISIGGTDASGNTQEVWVNTDGRLQVQLAAGTNAIGKLTANSGVDIGDVDVTSISAGTNAIGKVGHDITGMTHGTNIDVDTTAEQLDGSTSGLDVACKRVDLMASPANSGKIYVGGSDTIGAATGGIQLEPGDFYSIDIDNLNQIWIEASIADQALKYMYFT